MAAPRVFVSSTCYDLHEVRYQLRTFIEDFGFIPVMSEYGDIFYDYKKHVQDACKDEIEKSQLFILIIGNNYGLEVIEVLTGFKNIGAVMRKAEENKDKEYVFGFEESYGCLIGDYARDKDGIAAVMALCEAACYYQSKGMTLWDQMIAIYEKYGYYKETQVSIVREGAEGAEEIKQMMTNTRNKDIEKIGDYKVLTFKDIEKDYVKNMITGEESKSGFPKSNVLYYELEDNNWCCVRPSGTEPKIKLYMGVKGKTDEEASKKLEDLKQAMLDVVKR